MTLVGTSSNAHRPAAVSEPSDAEESNSGSDSEGAVISDLLHNARCELGPVIRTPAATRTPANPTARAEAQTPGK